MEIAARAYGSGWDGAVTVWVSTARKASARSSGVGSAATMHRVTLVAVSAFTGPQPGNAAG